MTPSLPSPTTTTLPVFFLSQITDGDESEDEFDGSGDDLFGGDGVGITAATQPSVKRTTSISVVTKVLTTTSEPSSTHRSTVLPRPYASVKEAAEQNPDYLGASIWNQVDTLPEPMVTGPAWRTNKSLTTTATTEASSTKSNRKTTTTTTTSATTTIRIQQRPNYGENHK